MGQPDYPLHEFTNRLANVEEKYAKEIQSVIECFTNSRLDLPVRKLEDVNKARMKTARYLRKAVDPKKTEPVNLWKVCNVYSAAAVDVDTAMRDIRASLRKSIKREAGGKDVSAFRRFVDEYRPANKKNTEHSQEIYDTNKPTLKEKQRFLDMFKKEKKDDRKAPLHAAEQSYTEHLVNNAKASVKDSSRRPSKPAPSPVARPTALPAAQPEKKTSVRHRREDTPDPRAESATDNRTDRAEIPSPPHFAPPEKPVAAPRRNNNRHSKASDIRREKKPAPNPPAPPIPARKPIQLPKAPSCMEEDNSLPKETFKPAEEKVAPTMIEVQPEVPDQNAQGSTRSCGTMASTHSILISTAPTNVNPSLLYRDDPPYAIYGTYYPKVSQGIQRFHTESQPAPPVLYSRIISPNISSEPEENSIHRL